MTVEIVEPSCILLSEDEAAHRLGITKELLFSYTRNAPKGYLGHKNKLGVVRHDRECRFSIHELDAWNNYLTQPWSPVGAERPPVPSYVDQYLKVECGGRCALCGKGHKLENAHIVNYALSASHHHHNLIRICSDCHSKYDDGLIPTVEIQRVKEALVQKIREGLQEKTLRLSRRNVFRVPEPNHLFIGRQTELAILKEHLDKERVVVIAGIGGIGKTQLTLQALKLTSDIETIWLDVESYGNLDDLQIALVSSLVKEGRQAEASVTLFDELDECPLRIVLDGLDRISLADWDRTIDFLNELLQLTRRPAIVITTQVELDELPTSFYRLNITHLSSLDSEELIRMGCLDRSGISISKKDIDWIVSFCEGHPLSLRLVLGLLGYYKDSRVVTQRLREAGTDELKDPVRKRQKRSTSLEVCLMAAYACFNTDQCRLLQFVSNFPAGCLELRASDWQQSDDFHSNLAELRRFFFIELRTDEWVSANRLHLLNPVREFIRKVWMHRAYKEAASIQLEAANRLMAEAVVLGYQYLETSTNAEDLQYGLLRIESELPNFIQALRYAELGARRQKELKTDAKPYIELVAAISYSLQRYFFIRGFLKEGAELANVGINALEELGRFSSVASQYVMLSNL